MARVYLGLGSNVGDRVERLRAAVRRLVETGEVTLVAASSLWESEPWEEEPGRTDHERSWYLNCVVAVETPLPPRALLERLQAVEVALGRTRPAGTPEAQRFAPRTVDIDLLFYDDAVISTPDDLHVPHLLLAERGFVLQPLAELAPDIVHPTLYQTVRELLDALDDPHAVRRGDYPARWLDA
jgi:2-amino-4-hydroxy-6-hydroxymethyldihydropteridine diphosphokinase